MLASVSPRDLLEMALLAACVWGAWRLVGRFSAWRVLRVFIAVSTLAILAARGLCTLVGFALLARVADSVLLVAVLGLLIAFQPELRRGLVAVQLRTLRSRTRPAGASLPRLLGEMGQALSRDGLGALIVVERAISLGTYAGTGEYLDAQPSVALVQCIFGRGSPLHDGAVIIRGERLAAAACQLPLPHVKPGITRRLGMRHRAAMCLSEETDALVLVVSEEDGCITLACGGQLEAVSPDHVSQRIAEVLTAGSPPPVAQSRAA